MEIFSMFLGGIIIGLIAKQMIHNHFTKRFKEQKKDLCSYNAHRNSLKTLIGQFQNAGIDDDDIRYFCTCIIECSRVCDKVAVSDKPCSFHIDGDMEPVPELFIG